MRMPRRCLRVAATAFFALFSMAGCDSPNEPLPILTSELGVVVSSVDRALTAFAVDTPTRKFTVGLGPDGSPGTLALRGAIAAVPLGTVNAVAIVNLREQRLIQTIALLPGSGATGAAFINDSIVLVANTNLNTVSPVNVLRGTRGADVPVGRFPQWISASGDTAFVLNALLDSNFTPTGPGTITVLVGYPSRVAGTIQLTGFNPASSSVRSDGTLLVVNYGRTYSEANGSVSIVNPRTLTETRLIPGFGAFPGAVTDDATGRLLVGAFDYGIAVWDPTTSTFSRPLSNAVKPGGIAGNSGLGKDSQGRVYALKPDCRLPSVAYRLDATFGVETEVPVGICPVVIAFTRVQRAP